MDSKLDLSEEQVLRLTALGLLCAAALRLFIALAWIISASVWLIDEPQVNTDEATGMTAMFVWGALSAISGTVMLLGGIKLAGGRGHRLARIGGVLCLLPCSPCCLLDVPLGAWIVYLLSKPTGDGAR